MIRVKEIVNSIFTSKTYILFCKGEDKAWLVDIGDIEPVVEFLQEKKLMVEGVFLTHGHFDHIYDLPSLLEHYPECRVYTMEFGKKSLASDRMRSSNLTCGMLPQHFEDGHSSDFHHYQERTDAKGYQFCDCCYYGGV